MTKEAMDESLRQYAESRATKRGAKSYETKYERYWHKRLSDRRERRLLHKLLSVAGKQKMVLDMPSGAGRLSPVFDDYAERMIEADYSGEMLEICRDLELDSQSGFVRVNALELPFADRSFDLAISIRLSHHIGREEDRILHLKELFRVSDRYVLSTYFDFQSLKNRLRRLRAFFTNKRPKRTLRYEQVEELAVECGFHLKQHEMLSWFFSGHRFCLFERT